MKTLSDTIVRAPHLKSCIWVALAAASVPLLVLPGCFTAMHPGVPAFVIRHGAQAAGGITPAASGQIDASSSPAPCPAINFQTMQQVTGSDIFFGLRRQADGSFTKLTYTADNQALNITLTGKTPHAEQDPINCSGLAARTRRAVAPGLNPLPLGIPSGNPIGVDLAGDGYGSLVGFGSQHYVDQVLLQRVNFDATAKSNLVAYPVGTGPAGIVGADFNGDGKADIAVVYTGSSPGVSGPGGVSILLGNGDGTVKPGVKYTTGANAINMTAFDFNGDGKADLAVGDYQGAVQMLLANADGTMRTGARYTMPTSEGPIDSLAAADVNGDRIPDLLVLTDANLHIYIGKGDGTFTAGTILPSGGTYGSPGVADFNGDGIPDIAIATQTAAAFIFLGTGAGKFATPVAYSTAYGAYGAAVGAFFIEDFDGDGFLDLVFGDGHPDAITAGGGSSVGVLFGNGDGTFASGRVYVVDGSTVYQTAPTPTNIAVADFNGDGKLDFATSNTFAKSVSVGLGSGGGIFKAPATISLTVQPTSITTGAFGSDGKSDIVVTDGDANIQMLYHNGDGTFQQPVKFPTGGNKPNFVVAGDFNGDKKLDVAVVNSGSNNVSVLPGFGDGSFNSPIVTAAGTNPVGAVAGDFNGDGKLDLAVANGGSFSASGTNLGNVSVLLGKGDGTFQAAVNYAAYQYPTFITAADVNGDGKADLIVASKGANGVDQIVVLAGTGSGTFKTGVPIETSTGPKWITAADFSGDGKLDLIVSHCCDTASLTALQGNGDGTFQPEVQLGVGSFFSSAVGDFDGNGKTDLAFTTYIPGSARTVTIYRNITVSQGSLTITNAAGNPLKAPPVAAYSIVTAKGTDLATSTVINSAANPPTVMGGTTIAVLDSAGVSRPAQLFYVSPTQVNFLIPQATATGNATITVTSGDGFVSVGTVAITAIAPAIFTLNSNSLAAAYVQRVHADGTQSIEYLYAVDGAGNVTFPGIDMGPATDQVYLNFYGTGIQGRSALSAVTVTVGGINTPPLYAGPSTYPGEDQVAILLPRSLAGAGTVNITLSANGNAANTTTLNIK